jgi:predicted porin
MKRLALSAALVLGLAGIAYADDPPLLTKAPPAPAPAAPAAVPACTNLWDFVATACPLSWYGITVYGTVDVGGGWELHSMPYNPVFGPGDFYPLAKASNISRFQYSPNALQQSVIGIKGIEPVWGQTSFIWTFEAGFMPFEALADAPGSVYGQRGLALTNQLANGDGGRYGAIYNSGIGFAGFTNPVWGTLTVGRQNTLALDGVIAYDPMGGSYAFSNIGFFGATAGLGNTEDARFTTALKYRENIGNLRIAGLWQFGGYEQDNAGRGAYEGQIGGDIPNFIIPGGTLSLDGIASYVRDSVAVGLAGLVGASGVGTNLLCTSATACNQVFTATLSNNTAFMALAKYKISQWTLYSGVEWMRFANPSDPVLGTHNGFTDVAGDFVCVACQTFNFTNISSTAYLLGAKEQISWWSGVRYAVTKDLDLVGAYYDQYYGTYIGSATSNIAHCATNPLSSGNCHGSQQIISGLIDWRFAPKWDLYFGMEYANWANGDAFQFLHRTDFDPTLGMRFRF